MVLWAQSFQVADFLLNYLWVSPKVHWYAKDFVFGLNLTLFLDQILCNKLDFAPSKFEAAVLLHINAKQKFLGWSVTVGAKSVEKHSRLENFFEFIAYVHVFSLNRKA